VQHHRSVKPARIRQNDLLHQLSAVSNQLSAFIPGVAASPLKTLAEV